MKYNVSISTIRKTIRKIIRESIESNTETLKQEMIAAENEYQNFIDSVADLKEEYFDLSDEYSSGRFSQETYDRYKSVKSKWEGETIPRIHALRDARDAAKRAYNTSLEPRSSKGYQTSPEEKGVYGYDPGTHDSSRPRRGLGT